MGGKPVNHSSAVPCMVLIYGTGYVEEVRDDAYIVRLTNWALAQGQSPTLYLQEEALKPLAGALPGTTVSTPFGPSQLLQIRPDNVHIAKPIHWKLANEATATFFLQPEVILLQHTPGFHEGDEVITVYGQGYIEKKRETDYVVKLRNWKLAQGQSPTLYLQQSALVKIPGLAIGSYAKTVWGLVRILDIRRDGTHVSQAVHWHLANDKPPTLYLAPEAFALLSIKP